MPRIVRRHTPSVKQQAVHLRRIGLSLDELSARLQVPKITVQNWVHAVPLSRRAQRRIHARIVEGSRHGLAIAHEANRRKLEAWKSGIREQACATIRQLRLTPAWGRALCGALYRCEGSRYPTSERMGFGNSDPRLIRLFLYLLRRYFAIDERKFRCQVIYRYDQSLDQLIRHWSAITSIPSTQFYRSQPDPRTKGKPTLRKDYRGVCYIQYMSTTLQYTLQCLGESVEEMVELTGVEPVASAMPSRRSPKLSYSPT